MIYDKVKTDCFAYCKHTNDCKALNYLYCKATECKFYKTKEQNKIDKALAEAKAQNKSTYDYTAI